jgi:hypothetical protein
MRKFVYYGSFASAVYFTDLFGVPAAAYSLRKLSPNSVYAGAAIRVRRSSDNTEQDINFVSSAPNAGIDTSALLTFVGAGNGFVTSWYNQNGSGNNFAQTSAGNQPRIVNGGVIDTRNTLPSFNFNGTSDFMDIPSSTSTFKFLHTDNMSFVALAFQAGVVADPNVAYSILDSRALSSNDIGYGISFDDRASVPRNNRIISGVARGVVGTFVSNNISNDNYFEANEFTILSNIIDNTNATASNRNLLYKNSTSLANNNSQLGVPSIADSTHNLRLGRRAGNVDFNLNGYVSEIIIYNGDKSADRTAIETNINDYYNVF